MVGGGVYILASAGAELLRDAVAKEKKIVLTRAVACSVYDLDRGDLACKPLDFFNGIDGSVSGVSYGNGCTEVSVSFDGSGDGDPVKSICICAQLKKDGVTPEYDPADDVVFAAWSDDNSGYLDLDEFAFGFSLPIMLSGIIDAFGAVDDSVTLDTAQTITGVKTLKPTDSPSSLCFSDYGLLTLDALSEGGMLLSIDPLNAEVDIKIGSESSQRAFMIDTIPLKAAYSTANKTIDLTLGDGTVVRLTCTNVEENPE